MAPTGPHPTLTPDEPAPTQPAPTQPAPTQPAPTQPGFLAGRIAEARRLAPFHLYRAAAVVAQALPGPLANVAAQHAAVAWGRRSTVRRAMIMRHLQRIHDRTLDPAALETEADRAFASYGRYWMESFRLPMQGPARLEAGTVYEGVGHLEAARAGGRGVIMAMPHLGAWDWGGSWLASAGFRLAVVVEALEPPELLEWFSRWRRDVGMQVIPLDRDAGAQVAAVLRRGEVAGLLCDRDLSGDGIDVEFIGERTKLPAGPAMLALRTGAPIIPCCVLYEGDHRRAIMRPPIDMSRRGSLREDVERITQDIADALAGLIRLAPEQWHVFQPNWPSDYM